jgi:hypothetical protein
MPTKIETNVVKPKLDFEYLGKNYDYLAKSEEKELDSKIKEITNFMNDNHGKGKSVEEKDELYLKSQKIWKSFIDELEKTKYNFYLNREQWKFLTDLILNKLEYDVNTVFFAIELKELFDSMKSSKYTSDEVIPYPVTATEITYIYHLISKHKVKGLSKESFLFSQVLLTIGNISKVFNYYDTAGKNLSTEIQDWVVTFEDGVSFENTIEA